MQILKELYLPCSHQIRVLSSLCPEIHPDASQLTDMADSWTWGLEQSYSAGLAECLDQCTCDVKL